MSKGLSARKKEAAKNFADLFEGENKTPEQIVVEVMNGTGNNQITDRQLSAAIVLLPYRLPKLNTVDAVVATEGMTHEQWIESMEDEEDDD